MRGLQNVVVVSSLALAGATHAQNAVQWRVEDGGNGHWYQLSGPFFSSWVLGNSYAEELGGHLVTLTSVSEQTFAATLAFNSTPTQVDDCWLGAFQDHSAPTYSEPAGGWRWVTGEPWNFTSWRPDGQPHGNGDFLVATTVPADGLGWVDSGPNHRPGNCQAFVEYSADCNNDGIVDYGQILAGTLADANQNNIPDCCEAGSPCPGSAVQWRVEDGGNGHWYQLSGPFFSSWVLGNSYAEELGGHLVTLTSVSEQTFAATLAFNSTPTQVDDCWLGAFQDHSAPTYSEPAGGWRWVTGEPWNFTSWRPDGQPHGNGDFLVATTVPADGLGWVDSGPNHRPGNCQAFVEYSADCNNDSIVDYGQILAGDLIDANANNIPDCCEPGASCDPCPGDVDESGAVNAVDLAAILNTWGSDGGKYPGADIDGNGTVDASDLTAVLSSWGACP